MRHAIPPARPFLVARIAPALASIVAAAAPSSAQEPYFADLSRPLPDASGAIRAMAFGDVDLDGDEDVIVVTFDSVHLYENDGNGRYDRHDDVIDVPVVAKKYFVFSAALGDLTRDGVPDLLIDTLVYAGDGAGRFTLSDDLLGATLYERHVGRIADLNGDGEGDVVVVERRTGTVSTFLNDAALGLVAHATVGVGIVDERFELVDLDGDGDLDLPALAGRDRIRPLLGDGAGGFADGPESQLTLSTLDSFVAGDVDGDGDADIVYSTFGGLRVARNDGAARFVDELVAANVSAFRVALARVDGDATLDVVTNDGTLLLGTGGGTFVASALPDDVMRDAEAVVARDADGDGDVDLFGWARSRTQLAYGDGEGDFVLAAREFGPLFDDAYPFVAADVDADGDLDAIGVRFAFSPGRPVLFVNDGAGELVERVGAFPATYVAGPPAVGDVNGDGALDLLFGTRFVLLLGDGAGGFVEAPAGSLPTGSGSGTDVALADLDGDGDLDAAVAFLGGGDQIWTNDGAGRFTVRTGAIPQPSPQRSSSVAAGDVDGDGDVDLVFGNVGPNGLFLNAGDGTFVDTSAALGANMGWTIDVALVDLTGDGRLDVYSSNQSGAPAPPGVYEWYALPGVDEVLRNDGGASFTAMPPTLQVPTISFGVSFGDLDLDGDLDAVVSAGLNKFSAQPTQAFLNDGDGTFSPAGDPRMTRQWQRVVVADFDGDGSPDAFDGRRYYDGTARQLATRVLPRIGRPLVLDVLGPARGSFVLSGATSEAQRSLGMLGTSRLERSSVFFRRAGKLDASGRRRVELLVPDDPALAGTTLSWQALVGGRGRGGVSFTGLERTTFVAF